MRQPDCPSARNTGKKRPPGRYLKDYKHSQTHCSPVRQTVGPHGAGVSRQIINKEAIARMDQPIDDAVRQNRAARADCAVPLLQRDSCNSHPSYFDIMAFAVSVRTDRDEPATIREYVVRLRRLTKCWWRATIRRINSPAAPAISALSTICLPRRTTTTALRCAEIRSVSRLARSIEIFPSAGPGSADPP